MTDPATRSSGMMPSMPQIRIPATLVCVVIAATGCDGKKPAPADAKVADATGMEAGGCATYCIPFPSMSFESSWRRSQERGLANMAVDLFTSLFAMGTRFAVVLGVMLFIVSLGRDAWNACSSHE